jgi:hypothetical protein
MNRYFLYIALILPVFWSCAPFEDPDIDIGPLPSAPNFSAEVMADDSNRVIIKVLSEGYFDLLWDLPGGEPKTSKKTVDTVLYRKAGTYPITLYVAGEGGGGTASAKKQVTIEKDATLPCDPTLSLLTGDCGAEGKCWTFSKVAGAITVGPTYGSGEWFTSTANGLVPDQYDDQYCFYFDGLVFEYNNNGLTVNPWDGYQAQPLDLPPGEWIYIKGAGMNGRDQIILSNTHFMGTRDSDNVLDVVILTETQLVVRTRIADQNGVPAAEGWFEFHFEAVE